MSLRNGSRMRKDKLKAGPSGCSRNDAFSLYSKYGLKDCLLPLDDDAMASVRELKMALGGEELIEFVDRPYAARAEEIFSGTLGVKNLTMENVWNVFKDLFPHMTE